jgi:hypothetical protein
MNALENTSFFFKPLASVELQIITRNGEKFVSVNKPNETAQSFYLISLMVLKSAVSLKAYLCIGNKQLDQIPGYLASSDTESSSKITDGTVMHPLNQL